jgi:hypothetical protein
MPSVKFAIDRRQQFARVGIAAVSTPQAGEAVRGAQLPKSCVLSLRGFQCCEKAILRAPAVGGICGEQYLSLDTLRFGGPPAFAGSLDLAKRLIGIIDGARKIAGAGIGLREAGQVERTLEIRPGLAMLDQRMIHQRNPSAGRPASTIMTAFRMFAREMW